MTGQGAVPVLLAELNLEGRLYQQPLGVEQQWSEIGLGVVDFSPPYLRVLGVSGSADPKEDVASQPFDAAGDPTPPSPTMEEVLVDDYIEEGTQMVLDDTCVVWNSDGQSLSFCIMFTTTLGHEVVRSALLHHQNKPQVAPFNVDPFTTVLGPAGSRAVSPAVDLLEALQQVLSASYLAKYFVAKCFVELDVASTPRMFSDEKMLPTLLQLHSQTLYDYLVSDDVFPVAVRRTTAAWVPQVDFENSITSEPWTIPDHLQHLPECEGLAARVTRSIRFHMLRHELPLECDETIVDSLVLLSKQEQQAAVTIVVSHDTFMSTLLTVLKKCDDLSKSAPLPHIIAAMRCLADVCHHAVSHRESATDTLTKLFSSGPVLRCLSSVAKRLAKDPDPTLYALLGRALETLLVTLNNRGDETFIGIHFRKPLSDAAAELHRTPHSSSASKALAKIEPLLFFLSLPFGQPIPGVSVSSAREGAEKLQHPEQPSKMLLCVPVGLPSYKGSTLQFVHHWLGMHDDEGTTIERRGDPEVNITRNQFHAFFVANVVPRLVTLPELPGPAVTLFSYMLQRFEMDNRRELLKHLLASRSNVVRTISHCIDSGSKPHAVAALQLSKAIVDAIPDADGSLIGGMDAGTVAPLVLSLVRRVTFDCDMFGPVLQALHGRTAVSRRTNLVQSELLATLEKCTAHPALHSLRKFLVLRHRAFLPQHFVAAVEAEELEALANACGSHSVGFSPAWSPAPGTSPTPKSHDSLTRRQLLVDEVDERASQLPKRLRPGAPAELHLNVAPPSKPRKATHGTNPRNRTTRRRDNSREL